MEVDLLLNFCYSPVCVGDTQENWVTPPHSPSHHLKYLKLPGKAQSTRVRQLCRLLNLSSPLVRVCRDSFFLAQTGRSDMKWSFLSHIRLCDSMNYIVHGILQARIAEWVAVPFPTQGWNTGLPHLRRILYWLSHQGSPEEPLQVEISLLNVKASYDMVTA